ncbi:hypothetical protein HaLaN_26832, partial [Haematococcus lacustris]
LLRYFWAVPPVQERRRLKLLLTHRNHPHLNLAHRPSIHVDLLFGYHHQAVSPPSIVTWHAAVTSTGPGSVHNQSTTSQHQTTDYNTLAANTSLP